MWWLIVCVDGKAQTVVLHDDEADARAVVEARSLSSAPALASISQVRARPPFIYGGDGAVASCGGAPDLQRVEELVTIAERALLVSDDPLAASLALARARSLALCSSPLAHGALARVWFLEGVIAATEDDVDRARRAFRVARAIEPALAWDAQFPDGRPDFDAARTPPPASTELLVVPPVEPADVRVDGAIAAWAGRTLVLPAGIHYLELVQERIVLEVEVGRAAQATLIVPALLGADVLGWPRRPERWGALDLVMRSLVSPDAAGWAVADDGRLWLASEPAGPYREIAPLQAARPPPPPWLRVATVTGAVGLAAAVGCGAGALVAREEVLVHTDSGFAKFAAAFDRMRGWETCFAAASGVAGTGLGLAVVVPRRPRSER